MCESVWVSECVRHILFTFHLLYILIYSHSILFHSVPFSISFNVAAGAAAIQGLFCVQHFSHNSFLLLVLNEKSRKNNISVVLTEAGCVTGVAAVAACFCFFCILFYKWIFICFMLVDYGFRTEKTQQQHIEKSSAMLFKMYTLCFILTSICSTHFENEYQTCTHTHTHTTLFDIFCLFCMIQTRNFKNQHTNSSFSLHSGSNESGFLCGIEERKERDCLFHFLVVCVRFVSFVFFISCHLSNAPKLNST